MAAAKFIDQGYAILDRKEAAAFLRCSDRKLWGLTNDGTVKCIKIGYSVRYDRRDLMAYIDSLRGVATEAAAK
ncbi:MAG TPA: helix-turn-helix domain-containing protein [Tepidisphaeraceae bacterium]|nr:helix-turn-helix domain-containing protein [Tepidisphaeraceae bacterium]